MPQHARENPDRPPVHESIPKRHFVRERGRRIIPIAEFAAEARKRFGDDPQHWKFVCPMCGTAQSAADLLATGKFTPGAGEANRVLGFSCIGRFTGQGDEGIAAVNAGKPWDKGCNWTLGGLLQTHSVELLDDAGKKFPHFDLAPAPGGEAA
jgi:hypothetical protein